VMKSKATESRGLDVSLVVVCEKKNCDNIKMMRLVSYSRSPVSDDIFY
jgi:hypothetical protein